MHKDANGLTRDKLIVLLKELSMHLQNSGSDPVELLLVGGSMLMLNGLRDATYDVDVFARANTRSTEFYQSLISVAQKNNLPIDWCNFDVQNLGYVVEKMEKVKVVTLSHLVIYGVSQKTLLTMKFQALFERYGSDEDDIYALLDRMGEIDLNEIKSHSEAILPRLPFDLELAQSIVDTAQFIRNKSQMVAFNQEEVS